MKVIWNLKVKGDIGALQQTALWNFLWSILAIPVNIAMASAIARAISAVSLKDREQVFCYAASFWALGLVQLGLTTVKKTYTERLYQKAVQRLKQSLYRIFMEGGPVLNKEEPAAYKTLFGKDVQQISEYYANVLPGVGAAVTGYVCYMLYVCLVLKGWFFAVCMTGLGTLSLLQPLILEKFLVRNFIAADQAESTLEQHLISGKEGFAALKLLGLHDWFMGEYRKKQKVYWKTGIKASASGTFNSSMEDINRFLQTLGLVILLGLGILQGQLTLEEALQIYMLSAQVYLYISTVFQSRTNAAACQAAVRQLEKYLGKDLGKAAACQTSNAANSEQKQAAGLLEVRQLCYATAEKMLLEHVNFSLQPGEKCLLRGENGAGKSTLFSLLLGETVPSEGRIIWGQQLAEMAGRADMQNLQNAENLYDMQSGIAYCPQAAPGVSFSAQTLYEKALCTQKCISRRKLEQYTRELGLKEEELKKPMDQLSGGTQKKVVLCLALAKQTPLLLLDEPEAMLDQKTTEKLAAILCKQNRTMVIVSHSNVFVPLADSVLWLEDKKIRRECRK